MTACHQQQRHGKRGHGEVQKVIDQGQKGHGVRAVVQIL